MARLRRVVVCGGPEWADGQIAYYHPQSHTVYFFPTGGAYNEALDLDQFERNYPAGGLHLYFSDAERSRKVRVTQPGPLYGMLGEVTVPRGDYAHVSVQPAGVFSIPTRYLEDVGDAAS